MYTAADICLVAGGVLVAGGLLMALLAPGEADEESESEARWDLKLSPRQVALEVRFP
jgi:hypothetical protein